MDQNEYIKQLEDANEFLISELDSKWKNECWFDRHRDNDRNAPIIRSELKVMGICVAYVTLGKDDKWSVYYLRREETKKFSGYRFCRHTGTKNNPSESDISFYGSSLNMAKKLAIGAIR